MKLTKSQELASMHYQGPALVLAVPGAGKTTVLLHRIDNLINHYGVNPKEILSITFSKAQAMDMEQRFRKNKKGPSAHFSTIHAFAYDIIRAYSRQEKVQIDLIEGSNSYNKYALVKRIYYNINKSFIKDDSLEEFFTAYSFIKNTMISPEKYLDDNKLKIKNFLKIYKEYESFKSENNLIDFDDMLTHAYMILQEDERILNRIRKAFKFIQVDEAQDTSKIQIKIITLIAQPLNNLFIVADDDQSIYGFRGAAPTDLLSFPKRYKDAKVFFMEENFRSSADIVGLANKFINKNKLRYKKNMIATKNKSEPIKLIRGKNLGAEHSYLIEEIKKNLEEDKSIAVLYRNNISGLALMDLLKENNISYFNRDKSKAYLSHFIIEDILNILKLAEDPSDINAYEKIYYKLNAYLKKDYLSHLRYMSGSMTIFDGLLDIPNLKDFQKENIINLSYDFKAIGKLKIPKAITYIERQLGYGVYLKDKTKKSGNEGYSPELILESLKEISKNMNYSYELEEKLKNIRHEKTNIPQNLTLSTIHSSKGLEFDVVYIIDLIEGEFPSTKAQELSPQKDDLAMEEERRLFYVGMTRARESLSLLSLKYRNHKRVEASSFYEDIRKGKQTSK